MRIVDFSFLQAFAAWNLSVQEMIDNNRRGKIKRKRLVKWKFYAVAAEEFMSYVDEDELSMVFSQNQSLLRDHQPHLIPKDFRSKYTHCSMCSIEEYIRNRVSGTAKTKGIQKWARQRAYLESCSNVNFKITAHTCLPVRTKIGLMGRLLGMSCFEIAHTPDVTSVFTSINRNGKTYILCVSLNPTCEELTTLYTQEILCQPIMIQLNVRPHPGRPKINSVSSVSSSDFDYQTNEEEQPLLRPIPKSRVVA